MTDQQKQNLSNILRLAKVHIDAAKKDAIERHDFDASIRIASNEGKVESHFRASGIDLDSEQQLAVKLGIL